MKVNSNIQAMIANNVLKTSESKFSASTEKLSSGYRINHAEDSPAGMAITNKMNAQIKSLSKAIQNTSNAVNVIQTAEGALGEIQSMVQRINELSVKASNGTMTDLDRSAIQKEINQLTSEIERVASDTQYNTQNLLAGEKALKGYSSDTSVDVINYDADFPRGEYTFDFAAGTIVGKTGTDDLPAGTKIEKDGDTYTVTVPNGAQLKLEFDPDNPVSADLELKGVGGMKIQVGTSEGQEVQLVIPAISLKNLGLEGIDCSTEEGARKSIEMANNALAFISSVRSSLGAYQNRLEATVSSLKVSEENLTMSYSAIKDVDMADEMCEYTKLQVLVQAGTSMLTQANEQPQQALQLLQ